MQRQFVASAYVFSEKRTLLIYHRKLQKWLCPGGHVDPNELPSEAAIREVLEETGLEVELLTDEHLWIDQWNATSFSRPYLCLLEEIPAYESQPAHQHIDFVYISRPVSGQETFNSSETDGLRWFTLEEVNALTSDREIFAETKSVIHSIFERLYGSENRLPKQYSSYHHKNFLSKSLIPCKK